MAIYRLSAQIISRSHGRSSTAAAAYRSGIRIEDQRTGQVHDYNRRSGVLYSEIMAPENTPDWMLDREALWNAVELVEKRKDAQLSREIQLALPHELSSSQHLSLLRNYVLKAFVSNGMVADIAIHGPSRHGDKRNHHAHIMLTMREIVGGAFGKKKREWNETSLIEYWRETWQEAVNLELERAGRSERVDHRRLDEQRLEVIKKAENARANNDNVQARAHDLQAVILARQPEPKIGYAAMAMERRGMRTIRGDSWRVVFSKNIDKLTAWVLTRRRRLEELWRRFETLNQVYEKARMDNHPDGIGSKQFTSEKRDALLGRTNKNKGFTRRSTNERER